MKHVDPVAAVQAAIALAPPMAMTRAQKLHRWADLIEETTDRTFYIFHNLEEYSRLELGRISHPDSAFQLALAVPEFRAIGVAGDRGDLQALSALGAMRFFELSQQDLHEFSCDCGGHISNQKMASRIRIIANRA